MIANRVKAFIFSLQNLIGIFIALTTCAYTACSNSEMVCFDSEEIGSIFSDSVECNISSSTTSKPGSTITEKNLRDTIKEYLTLDDTEYPYANIPRIVIETENRRAIEDRETEIPAKFQIWGEKSPESEIMGLTIRGRGNSSWDAMPKHSYKIEFNMIIPAYFEPRVRC